MEARWGIISRQLQLLQLRGVWNCPNPADRQQKTQLNEELGFRFLGRLLVLDVQDMVCGFLGASCCIHNKLMVILQSL